MPEKKTTDDLMNTILGQSEANKEDEKFDEVKARLDRQAAARRKYAVQAGDTLGSIAVARLGDAARWKEIYEANKDVIGDNPDLIEVGMKLTLPAK